ncbi:transketolase family protein [Acetivibrio cellulolyticus]|uniref:transketolase family protein n=1 Tax=Acetivibrio cellulolyticus TaxID=35830 RepID=UPI0001E2FB43|nr:transketolase C-terminal domain-containing protein [Acetivibrio cellulolyticus]
MRTAYLNALYQLTGENPDILALISDNGAIVYDKYRADFPKNYFNFGISEANMVAAAAGLASCGKIPFAYTISGFLTMRAFEFVRNDVCLQNQNVKLVGTGAGFAYSTLGPTHHATEDIALMRVLPNMTIFSPASPKEVEKVTYAAAKIMGPVYIRLGTNKEPEIYERDYNFVAGEGVNLLDGKEVTLIATGSIVHDVLECAKELHEEGISVQVVNIHTIKPIDNKIILEAAEKTRAIITIEEHSIIGGLGSAVAEVLMENCFGNVMFKRMGLNNTFCKGYGSHSDLKSMNGLSKECIKQRVREACMEKKGRI